MLYEFKGAHAPHAPSKSATLFLQSILQLHVNVLFRNYKMDENSRPSKQARLDTFLIPRRDEKSQR
jgi:hypothetical protein